jgi:hypothetical protein
MVAAVLSAVQGRGIAILGWRVVAAVREEALWHVGEQVDGLCEVGSILGVAEGSGKDATRQTLDLRELGLGCDSCLVGGGKLSLEPANDPLLLRSRRGRMRAARRQRIRQGRS